MVFLQFLEAWISVLFSFFLNFSLAASCYRWFVTCRLLGFSDNSGMHFCCASIFNVGTVSMLLIESTFLIPASSCSFCCMLHKMKSPVCLLHYPYSFCSSAWLIVTVQLLLLTISMSWRHLKCLFNWNSFIWISFTTLLQLEQLYNCAENPNKAQWDSILTPFMTYETCYQHKLEQHTRSRLLVSHSKYLWL